MCQVLFQALGDAPEKKSNVLKAGGEGTTEDEMAGWHHRCNGREFLQAAGGGDQESSPTPQFKTINSLALSLLHSPTLTSIHDYWKNHSLD